MEILAQVSDRLIVTSIMFIGVAVLVLVAVVVLAWKTIQARRVSVTALRSGWLPLAWLGIAGVVGFVLLTTLIRPRLTRDPQPLQPVSVQAVTMEVPQHATDDDGEVWRDVVDEEFDSDIYPSPTVAARALAHQIAPMVKFRVLPKDTSPTAITIVPQSGLPKEGDFSVELASRLQTQFEVPATIGEAPGTPPAEGSGQVIVTLTCPRKTTHASSPWNPQQPEVSGSLKATVSGEAGDVEVMSQFIDKPWVAQFDQFVSANPERNLLLARSARFSTSAESAFVLAEERGADSITRMLMPLVGQSRITLIPDIEVHTRNTVRWLIHSGVFVQDRFVQRLKRPYGDVYRAAVLFEVEPHQLETLKGEIYTISRSHQREQHASVSFMGGAIAIFGVVTLLCLFLNHATRGYYRAKLSAVCLCGGAVLIGGAVFWLTLARSEVDLRTRLTVQDLTRQNAVPMPRSRQKSSVPIQPAAPPAVTAPARPVPTPPKVQVNAPRLEESEGEGDGKIDPVPEDNSATEGNTVPE